MKRIYLSILVLSILILNVATQNGEAKNAFQNKSNNPVFQHLSDEDGFPMIGVTNILQDRKGFLWVGTFYGLFRFDGYRFVSFKNDIQDQQSITDNNIKFICETKSGDIWIGTENGLNRYDSATHNFVNYLYDANDEKSLRSNDIVTLFEDSNDTLWIGTGNGGLSKFNSDDGSFTNYQNLAGKDNGVFSIAEDKNGGFWITNRTDLYKFNRETGSVKNYPVKAKNTMDSSKPLIHAIFIDRSGIIWLGSVGGGLNRFDPITETFKYYYMEDSNPNSLNDDAVLAIYETKAGDLWVGTVGGLNLYSKETDDFEVYKHDPNDSGTLTKGEVWTIFEDTNEQLWIGGTGGLDKYNQRTNRFARFKQDSNDKNSINNNQILSIYEDKNNILWICTRNTPFSKLLKYDLKQDSLEFVEVLNNIRIFSMFEDKRGKFWLGTDRGLFHLDRESGKTKMYKNDPNDPDSIGGNYVVNIKSDNDGNLLLATLGKGISKFNSDSGKFTRIQHDPNDPGSLSDDQVYSMLEDSGGQLWIGGQKGLNKYVPETKSFIKYQYDPKNPQSISGSEILSLYEDKSGTLWIGTSTGGLNRFDRETGTFEYFTKNDGLPSNDVFQILEDDQGYLWLFTDRGLGQFDKTAKKIQSYTTGDGVPYNPFDDKTAFKNSSGEFYFGGLNGFVKFDPKDFALSQFTPPVYLTGIRVLEKPLKLGKDVTELKELNLSWQDYVVSFDFAALDFENPKNLKYQWKLEGFNDDWIKGGTLRTATYTNLPGGSYVLKVKATNVDGVWTEEAINLKITVTPPFYRTYWFFGLVTLAVGLFIWFVIWFLYRNHINKLKAISKAQTVFTRQLIESQEAERKRLASELHDGLGQDLVIIKNRAFLAQKNSEDQVRLKKELDDISETTSHTLQQVREITEGLRPMLLDKMGLTKALKIMLEKFSGVVEIESNIDSIDELFSENEEINVYRIVQESVNNIIKHSNAANAFVEIEKTATQVLITIKDNGDGFDTEDVRSSKVSGLGLVGLKERTNSLNGEFSINSVIDKGTTVLVKIPN